MSRAPGGEAGVLRVGSAPEKTVRGKRADAARAGAAGFLRASAALWESENRTGIKRARGGNRALADAARDARIKSEGVATTAV